MAGDRIAQGNEDDYRNDLFDPWLTTTLKFPKVIADNLITNFDRLEPPRKRKRRAEDQANLEAILHALLANMAFAVARGDDRPTFGVSFRAAKQKHTRYDRKGFDMLPRVVETLAAYGRGEALLRIDKSKQRGQATTVEVAPRLADSFRRVRFRPEHFVSHPGAELIRLNTSQGALVNYRDDATSRRLRAEMREINDALSAAAITLQGARDNLLIQKPREVVRSFRVGPQGGVRFDLGGRLWGGWWQNLAREERHRIRINGEPIADLDFANMFLRLAYIEAGHEPPEGDLYRGLVGLTDTREKAGRWREGAKVLVNAMLFRNAPLAKVPRNAKGKLPPGTTGPIARAAVLGAHPHLRGVLEHDRGMHLMFRESEVLVDALLRLAAQRIPALPMHDGLMVGRSAAPKAIAAMAEASLAKTGCALPITMKSLKN